MKLYLASLLLCFVGCKAPAYQAKFTNYSGLPVEIYETTYHKDHRVTLAPGEWEILPLSKEVRKKGASFLAEGKWQGRTIGITDFYIPPAGFNLHGYYYPPAERTEFDIVRFNPLTQWGKRLPGSNQSPSPQPAVPTIPHY